MPNITTNHAITYTNTSKRLKNVVWTLYIKIAMSCNLLYKVGNFALCNFVYLSQGVVLSVMRQFLCFLKVLVFFFRKNNVKSHRYWISDTLSSRAVFKWLSKNQNQSNYSDQSQPEQAARWTNHNS